MKWAYEIEAIMIEYYAKQSKIGIDPKTLFGFPFHGKNLLTDKLEKIIGLGCKFIVITIFKTN